MSTVAAIMDLAIKKAQLRLRSTPGPAQCFDAGEECCPAPPAQRFSFVTGMQLIPALPDDPGAFETETGWYTLRMEFTEVEFTSSPSPESVPAESYSPQTISSFPAIPTSPCCTPPTSSSSSSSS